MSRTVPSYTVEGLQRRLLDMEREIRDLHRRGSWNFDAEMMSDAEIVARGGIGQMLTLSATADSIASGGDYVTFAAVVYQHEFGGAVSPSQSITWPASAAGEIQVEFAWDSYQLGGTIEIEVDGVVPAWGILAEGLSGQAGWKKRSVHITETSVVKIKVTQSSGSTQLCDVFAQFSIPDPTPGPGVLEETLWLDTRVGSVTSTVILKSGQEYRVDVEGNVDVETDFGNASGSPEAVIYPSAGQGASNDANNDADTKYALVSPGDSGAMPAHSSSFLINTGSGASHIEPVGGPYTTPTSGHVYEFLVNGEGSTVTFSYPDSDYNDNNGQFRIDIVRVV